MSTFTSLEHGQGTPALETRDHGNVDARWVSYKVHFSVHFSAKLAEKIAGSHIVCLALLSFSISNPTVHGCFMALFNGLSPTLWNLLKIWYLQVYGFLGAGGPHSFSTTIFGLTRVVGGPCIKDGTFGFVLALPEISLPWTPQKEYWLLPFLRVSPRWAVHYNCWLQHRIPIRAFGAARLIHGSGIHPSHLFVCFAINFFSIPFPFLTDLNSLWKKKHIDSNNYEYFFFINLAMLLILSLDSHPLWSSVFRG